MFEFYWPYFAILLPLPFIAIWLLPKMKQQQEQNLDTILFPNLDYIKASFNEANSSKQTNNNIYLFLLILFWIFLILSLMRPQIVDHAHNIQEKGHDIMLAVDASMSMQALDMSTSEIAISRLDVSKNVIKNFVAKRTTDRLGLILFGEHAYLQVPLTRDTNHVSKMLDNAIPGIAGQSTAIGDAIGVSIKTLHNISSPADYSKHANNLENNNFQQKRILILLTDGADNASIFPPDEAAVLAKKYGVKIYTIGIGRNGEVPMPDEYGKIHMVQFDMDEKLLQKIADITGGVYFKAEDDSSLEKIYQQIDQMEKISYDVREFQIRRPLFRYPLGAASVIFVLLAVMPLFKPLFRPLLRMSTNIIKSTNTKKQTNKAIHSENVTDHGGEA